MKLNEISTIKMKSFEINSSNIVGETTRNNFNHEQLVQNNLINKDLLHFQDPVNIVEAQSSRNDADVGNNNDLHV